MAEENTPLTDAERAELEELRAEKARRDRERAARERAELEALRAELDPAAPAAERPAPERRPPAADPAPKADSFGVRMVTNGPSADGDEVPGMAPAQKLIIALCLAGVVIVAVYMALNGGV